MVTGGDHTDRFYSARNRSRQLLEPRSYGHATRLSSRSIVVAAIFSYLELVLSQAQALTLPQILSTLHIRRSADPHEALASARAVPRRKCLLGIAIAGVAPCASGRRQERNQRGLATRIDRVIVHVVSELKTGCGLPPGASIELGIKSNAYKAPWSRSSTLSKT